MKKAILLLALLPMLGARQFQVGQRGFRVTPPSCTGDSFSGSGSLGANWTSATYTGPSVLTKSGGVVSPSGGTQGSSSYTCTTFTTTQDAAGAAIWASGTYSGPGVFTNSSGDGVYYYPSLGDVYWVVGGMGSTALLTAVPL